MTLKTRKKLTREKRQRQKQWQSVGDPNIARYYQQQRQLTGMPHEQAWKAAKREVLKVYRELQEARGFAFTKEDTREHAQWLAMP